MEITENTHRFTERPKKTIRKEVFEKSRTLSSIYLEILNTKAYIQEKKNGVLNGFSLGSFSEGTRSFLFTTPYWKGDTHTYVLFTLNGFKGVSFSKSEEGKYVNGSGNTETQFIDSMHRFNEEYDPSNAFSRTSADMQGFTHTHMGQEIFRSPDSSKSAFLSLLSFTVDHEASDDAISEAVNSLDSNNLDSVL